jgi:membrane dipeptidase
MTNYFSMVKQLLIFIPVVFFLSGFKNPGAVHKKAIVIDTHTDTPMQMINHPFDLGTRHDAADSKVDFPRLREGGVDAVFFALFTGQQDRIPENYDKVYRLTYQMIDSTLISLMRYPDYAELAKNSDDVFRISKKGKTAIYLGMENGFPLAKDLSRIREFYDIGVRYITLSHSKNNDICDSSTDPDGPEHNGLSDFGKEVVKEMNNLGMIIDVSHISDKAFYDVIELSKAPVIASHSSVRSICNHPRNMSDDMIKRLAEKGGVIQICILGDYIREADTTSVHYIKLEKLRKKYHNWKYASDDERKAAWAEWDSIDRNFPEILPTVSQAVDHIDYVVRLVGIDHVGIGSDFDGGGGLADCTDVTGFPRITEELVKRGYSQKEINKIWGGNFLRVFSEVEKTAEK